tara:strand:- start:90 stop:557 length:468 start_codon:yes stop_codon:yes gene_type:complete
MYAHVKEGGVDYLGSLPKSWGNVSNLCLSNGNDAYLKTLGWLPLVEINAIPTVNQRFDTDVVTVEEDRVILTHRVIDMTEAEITERNESNLQYLREDRDQKLVDSDWTQVSDYPPAIFSLSDSEKSQWATYRQALRDLPANTPDPANPTWPVAPA